MHLDACFMHVTWLNSLDSLLGQLARRRKLRRQKELGAQRVCGASDSRRFEAAWAQWMRTEGRKQGLTERVPFDGPKLGHELTEELDSNTDVEAGIT